MKFSLLLIVYQLGSLSVLFSVARHFWTIYFIYIYFFLSNSYLVSYTQSYLVCIAAISDKKTELEKLAVNTIYV